MCYEYKRRTALTIVTNKIGFLLLTLQFDQFFFALDDIRL